MSQPFPFVDGDVHAETWASETAEWPGERDWLRWIDVVEKLLGHDADGDNSDAAKEAGTADGYSLDEFYDLWKAGRSPQQAVDGIPY